MHLVRKRCQFNETSPNMHFDEKTKSCQFNETSPNMHFGEKNIPIQRDKPPIFVRKQRIYPLNETSHPIWVIRRRQW
ncbi:hypothetical protein TNCV_3026511 [Trichonephila clavipes]|nr:hypothetical protein TNCV_3026511 [Trichonephila clavipes]